MPKDMTKFDHEFDNVDYVPKTDKQKRIKKNKYKNTYEEGTVDWYLENARENFQREGDAI